MDWYCAAYHTLLATFQTKESWWNVLLTDECISYYSHCMRSVVLWTKENPGFMMELEHNPPHTILLVGNRVTCITGPYFDRHIKTSMHRAMLEMWLIPEPRIWKKMNGWWLQHDGAPTHFATTVCDILNDHFSCRRIGHGSKTSPTTLMWPPHTIWILPPRKPSVASLKNTLLQASIVPTKSCTGLCYGPSPSLLHGCHGYVTQNMAVQWTVFWAWQPTTNELEYKYNWIQCLILCFCREVHWLLVYPIQCTWVKISL